MQCVPESHSEPDEKQSSNSSGEVRTQFQFQCDEIFQDFINVVARIEKKRYLSYDEPNV